VLAILRDRRLRMTALADYLGLERSTMTGLVDRAEKRGLLERAPNASDGKQYRAPMLPAGRWAMPRPDRLAGEVMRLAAPPNRRQNSAFRIAAKVAAGGSWGRIVWAGLSRMNW
jgi:hypothetical protein